MIVGGAIDKAVELRRRVVGEVAEAVASGVKFRIWPATISRLMVPSRSRSGTNHRTGRRSTTRLIRSGVSDLRMGM